MEERSDQPRLVFNQMTGFQAMDEQGKVKTILFLNASREVVTIIGELALQNHLVLVLVFYS